MSLAWAAHLHSYYLLKDVLPKSSGAPAESAAKHAAAGSKCPFMKGDDAFLLSLDSLGEANEPHALLRGIMFDYLLDPAAQARGAMSDPYTRELHMTFKAAYDKQKAAGEYDWSERELGELVLRWVHYALFGLKLDSEEFETLRLLYLAGDGFPPAGTKYHFFPKGIAGGNEAVPGTTRPMSELRAAAIALYLGSAGLKDYKAEPPLSKADFCEAMISIITLAGIAGPLSAAQGVLKGKWHGEVPEDFPMPATDRDKLCAPPAETPPCLSTLSRCHDELFSLSLPPSPSLSRARVQASARVLASALKATMCAAPTLYDDPLTTRAGGW